MQKISVKALFHRHGQYLFVKDTKGTWELPGGKLEFGETPEQTLTRELGEELGWKNVVIENLVHAWTFVVQKPEEDIQYIVLVYACSSDEQNIQDCEEYQEYAWLNEQDTKALQMRDGYKDTVRRFSLTSTPNHL